MKNIDEFFSYLRSLNVRVWVKGENLCYRAPEGVLTKPLLAQLKTHKQEIVAFISKASQASCTVVNTIGPISRLAEPGEGKKFPLSFAQERLWFLNQLEPENPFYNIYLVLSLCGILHIEALQKSINEVVRRHEVLRTNFIAQDGKPVQVICQQLNIPLSVIDLRNLSKIEQSAKIRHLAEEEATKPFDLNKDLLFRAKLLQLEGSLTAAEHGEYVLLLTMHHIISDGWSLGIIFNELAALYEAYVQGLPSPLPELSIQYADFALWQRQWFQGKPLEEQLSYWKKQLTGIRPVIELPTDRPRPPVQSYRGGSERFEIDSDLCISLRILSHQSGATLFMMLLSAFALLLSRYSDQEDIAIGSPIANRNRKEIEPLIGFFVNTIVLRIDLSGDPTFQQLLERVRQTALEAYAHQDLPFEKLVNELQPARDLSRNPLFQVMFALHNAPKNTLKLPDLHVSIPDFERTSSLFDMVVDMWELEDKFTGVLEYNKDLFEQSTIKRMISHFKNVLEAISMHPDRPLSALTFLTSAEMYQIMHKGKGERIEYPIDKCIHQLFEEQVNTGPDRVAAVFAGQHITYGALNARANQIAHFLRQRGLKASGFVGILETRSIDFLSAMLGIFKAGGAYVPIDPDYPKDRVLYMVKNSQINILITREVFLERFFKDEEPGDLLHILCLDKSLTKGSKIASNGIGINDRRELEKMDTQNLDCVNTSRDLAYMIYTSGSTGLPKGAMVRHDGAVNHIYAQFDTLNFNHDTAFLQSAPSSADISVWQFIAPLLIGGKTVIIDLETICNPIALLNVIRCQDVTLIELVPAVMKEFLDYTSSLSPDDRSLPKLIYAMVTGEAVSVSLVNQWLNTYPSIALVNAYGPTEAADDICQMIIEKPLPKEQMNVPIGRPLANMTLYVLDEVQRLLPVGLPGEISVAGVGVGAGYWQNDEKTSQSFIMNPYTENQWDQVLYRTGDRGRWLPDGTLEFLGRMDHQVKIRGFRIELGEIEGVLGQHPTVGETVVKDQEDKSGERVLVAYIVPQMDEPEIQGELNKLQIEQVTLWEDLNENTYNESPSHEEDPTFNTIGWDSTYTGLPLTDQEMHEYIDYTVSRVLSYKPGRVLEIGCGTGLLLYQIAPHCSYYCGTDISQVALQKIESSKPRVKGVDHVTLLHKRADDFEGIKPGSFDMVLLCSVVQYFPGIDYLVRVLENAINAVHQNGIIFLGDIRNLSLLEAYHTSVQFYKAPDEMTGIELKKRVQQQLAREQELAIDPAFFIALKHHFPQISHVSILPKRGQIHNEMTRFRYDVVLHLHKDVSSALHVHWVDWQKHRPSLSDIHKWLTDQHPETLGLRRVASTRVSTEMKTIIWLAEIDDLQRVGQFRKTVRYGQTSGIDPEAIQQIRQYMPYDVVLSVSVGRRDGSYDVVFNRRATNINSVPAYFPFFDETAPVRPFRDYANNPLKEKLNAMFGHNWRAFLKNRLPDHMVPRDFMILDKLPLLPNGKIDREALPEPENLGYALASSYVAPRTPVQEALASIWAEVLGVEKVGIQNNFFELGGHSLKAMQVVSQIQKTFGLKINVRSMFNSPTIEELAEEITSEQPTRFAHIEKAPNAAHYPLSHAQRRLWVLSQLEGASVAYNMPDSLMIEGKLSRSALKKAFSMLIQRHEILRTTFTLVNGEPRQKVHENLGFRINFIDLTDTQNPEQQAHNLAREESRKVFDLENGPLIRISLLKVAESKHVLLFNMHHIIFDGYSIQVMVREFVQFYESIEKGTSLSMPPLFIQYRDYTIWQNCLLQNDAVIEHRKYWYEKLSGELPVLNLRTDYPRPPVKTYNGSTHFFRLSKEQTEALIALGRKYNATLFIMLATLVKVLLYRYSGQEDIILGFVSAGRDHPDLEDQIGFYVNTIVLRSHIQQDISFESFLEQMRETALEAYEHQIYPFNSLVDELKLNRDVSRSPLFDVVMGLQNVDTAELFLGNNLKIRRIIRDFGTCQFDLVFNFEEKENGLELTLGYNTDLFSGSRIDRLGNHFVELVKSVLSDSTQSIGRLNLLTASERHKLLFEFNDTKAHYPSNQTIVDLFEDQVRKTPDAVAVLSSSDDPEKGTFTYRELNRRANQLSHYLRQKGVKPDSLVAVLDDRSPEMIVNLLGILKAGAAYVPLEPKHPTDRILSILEDSQVKILLTRSVLSKSIPFTMLKNLQNVSEDIIISPKRSQILDLDKLPFPDRKLVNYTKYEQYIGEGCVKKGISIIATRGCPYHCLYCHKIWPKKHRMRSAHNIFEEVKGHYDRGYRTFSFLDDIFNLNRHNSETFFTLIIKNNMKIRLLFPNGLRGDILSHDYIDLMAEAGVIQMALALETASERLQKLIHKNLDIEKLRENLLYISQKHPHIVVDLFTMVGFPTETQEEAMMTLDFIKSIKWLHFPQLHVLKIYPNTDMARFAMESGITKEAIEKSTHLPYHEVSETLPFSKQFVREFHGKYMQEYFLLPERLQAVIPLQKQVLTREETVAKYDSYLPGGIENFPEILGLIGNGEADKDTRLDPAYSPIMSPVMKADTVNVSSSKRGLRILLIDTSVHFSGEGDQRGFLVEAPLGLIYLMTYLTQEFGNRIDGKIIQSMIDFNNFKELKTLIDRFQPEIIGLRTLSLYKNFFHETVEHIKSWYPNIPIITGGPYATSEFTSILSDQNIDLAVLGEGEITLAELIGKVLDNNGKMPDESVLQQIPGLAFLPDSKRISKRDAGIGREVLLLDKMHEDISLQGIENPKDVQKNPENNAYVIYTSGSTGKPKGCEITHRNVVRLMKNDRFQYDFGPDDVWVVAHSFVFDFSVWEMYGALLYGGRVLVARHHEVQDTELFYRLLHKYRVTVLNQTPAAFYNLIDVERSQKDHQLNSHLRYVIFGGDRLEFSNLKPWVDIYPLTEIILVNMYGITETTVHVTLCPLSTNDIVAGKGRSPIGVPLPETQVYVCDGAMNSQPIGVPGEIYVGGTGVSRGYLNQPFLTAERFIDNPFKKGERLYRSGDLGCWRDDGTLEHLGRNDSQVQLRGFRIELGEIEAVLGAHAGVRKNVVISRGSRSFGSDTPDNRRLIAYIVPESNDAQLIPELRRLVKEKLPDYMVPSAFVMLNKMPLTANNKIDHKALPDPDQSRPELDKAYVQPQNETERVIARVWQDVLNLEKVGIYDNFFDIGGSSLSIIQVNKRLKSLFNRDIAVVEMFKYATIHALSQYLSQSQESVVSVASKIRNRVSQQKQARKQRNRPGKV